METIIYEAGNRNPGFNAYTIIWQNKFSYRKLARAKTIFQYIILHPNI
jgi:hypothetical protein